MPRSPAHRESDSLLTWLHVSDLHFKEHSCDADEVCSALVDAVRRERENGEWVPDIILVTGDVANRGKAQDYRSAGRFFDALLKASALPRDRLVVVPGNHDVDRNRARGLSRTLSSQLEANEYFEDTAPRYHFNKLQAFFDWQQEYFGEIPAMSRRSTCGSMRIIEVDAGRVGILPINTALFSAGDDDHGKLWVGQRPLREALEELQGRDLSLTLALMHHPIDWLHGADRGAVTRLLRGAVDLILHGHLHDQEVESVVSSRGNALHVAAGAAYQGSEWPNRVVYGRVLGGPRDSQPREVELYPLRYETETGSWLIDPTLFPDQPPLHRKRFMLSARAGAAARSDDERLVPAARMGTAGVGADAIAQFIDELERNVRGDPGTVDPQQALSYTLKVGRVLKSEMGHGRLLTELALLARGTRDTAAREPTEAQQERVAQRSREEVERLLQLLRKEEESLEALRRTRAAREAGAESSAILEVNGVVKALESGFSVGPISLVLARGDIVVVVGPNGSGKTTFLRCLAHEIAPTRGSVVVRGARGRRASRRAKLGYIPQRLEPWTGTFREQLQLVLAYHEVYGEENSKAVATIADEFHIAHLLDRQWHQLSGGEKTLCALAEQVAIDPPILILDEPLAALDPWVIPDFLGQLHEESRLARKSVIFSTQSIFDAESIATQILVLRDGKVSFFGPPSSICEGEETQLWRLELGETSGTRVVDVLRRALPGAILELHESTRHVWVELPKPAEPGAGVFDALVAAGLQDDLLSVRNLTRSAIRKMKEDRSPGSRRKV